MADLSKQPLFLQSMFLIFISCTFILQFSASNDVGFAFGEALQRKLQPATYLRALGNLSWQFWRAVTDCPDAQDPGPVIASMSSQPGLKLRLAVAAEDFGGFR